MIEQHVYSVSEINRSARGLLESELGEVWLKGEVVTPKMAASGHFYFTLKDADARIDAVRFRGRSPIVVVPEEGTVVLVFGRVTVYEPNGRYQFVASLVQPVGAGLLHAAFERLKAKLKDEGLFDAERKRALPAFPRALGVVTSPAGAALHDILAVLERRWPLARVILFPSAVQGEAAPGELVAAIERAGGFALDGEPLDLLIVGRGGGSAEDLAAFNDEHVARAVAACPVPVVSAVGHDVDVSIVDFVADLRAATPSAAAELATPDQDEVAAALVQAARRMQAAVDARWEHAERTLRLGLRASLVREPRRLAETRAQRFDGLIQRLAAFPDQALGPRVERLRHMEDLLRLTDPRRPLERGYSITRLVGSGLPLRRASDAKRGQEIETVLAQGSLRSRVDEVTEG